jgi:hypothetical protein
VDLRDVVERRCDNKAYYKVIYPAEQQAKKLSKKLKKLMIAYKCLDCDGYHVGTADLSQTLAHAKKKKPESWKKKRNKALQNVCPRCGSRPGNACQELTPVNGRSVLQPRLLPHKGRLQNVL